MEKVKLGKTGIEVSKMGIGTGTAHPSGVFAQSLLGKRELAEVLLYAFDHGINFWDTAFQYRTYPHVRGALKNIKRSDVVLVTKLTTADTKETIRDFDFSLREVETDYFDVCLIHGVRKETEFKKRIGAFEALLKLKHEGKIRAVGLSSHGLSALKAGIRIPEIDVIWARINYAGIYMDTCKLFLYDELSSVPCLKKCVKLLPEAIKTVIQKRPVSQKLTLREREEVEDTLKKIHDQSKGVVGMKILLEGHLANNLEKSLTYVMGLPFVDAFIVGMMNKREVEENCKIVSRRT